MNVGVIELKFNQLTWQRWFYNDSNQNINLFLKILVALDYWCKCPSKVNFDSHQLGHRVHL